MLRVMWRLEVFVAEGGETSLTVSSLLPADYALIIVSYNGVERVPNVHFTSSGATISLNWVLNPGDIVTVRYAA